MTDRLDSDELTDDVLTRWPNCATPDCPHKRCLWSGTVYCARCAEALLGPEEMDRRERATHRHAPRG